MSSFNFYNRPATLLVLPLTLLDDTTHFVDFHKRSETSYNDFTVDHFDLPFEKFVKRDGSVVDIAPDTVFNQDGIIKNTNPEAGYEAIVTPEYVGYTAKYDFDSPIPFVNNFSSTTTVELVSGSVPEGLVVEVGTTGLEYVRFYGNIKDEHFDLSLDDYRNLHIKSQQNQLTVFMNVEYIDNLVDKNVITNPSSTLSSGDELFNVEEASSHSREIESVERYVDSNATVISAENFAIGTEYSITKLGNTKFNEIGASSIPTVGEIFIATGAGGDGTTGEATSDIKLKVKIKTYILKYVSMNGEYIEIYEPFMVSQKRKFDPSTMIEEPLDDNWRGYVKTSDVSARYEDIMYEDTTMDLFKKGYEFTLSLKETSNGALIETKTFNLTVHASPEALRNNFDVGRDIRIRRYIDVNYY